MSHPLVALLERLRTVFAKESLPPPPAEGETRRGRRGFARLLFSIEELPLDPTPPAHGRRSVLASIFAADHLSLEPERPPRRHTRWLSWLFFPERIDRGPNPPEDN